jgi:hypothetical protein
MSRNPNHPPKASPFEIPSDPHAVASALSIEEQKKNAELRKLFAKKGIIPQDLVPELDVDIKRASNPFLEDKNRQRIIQADMDHLATTGEPEAEITGQKNELTPEEWEAILNTSDNFDPAWDALKKLSEKGKEDFFPQYNARVEERNSNKPIGTITQSDSTTTKPEITPETDSLIDVVPEAVTPEPVQEPVAAPDIAPEIKKTEKALKTDEPTEAIGEEPNPNSNQAHYLRLQKEYDEEKRRKEETTKTGTPSSENERKEPYFGPEVDPQKDTTSKTRGTARPWKEKGKIDTSDAEYVKYKDIPDNERTPAESRSFLRGLIEKAKWYGSSKENLIRRNEELDEKLEKIGGKTNVERGFRWVGEKYNKMPFKYKLALGAALGLGTVATAGTLAVALPLLGVGAQRIAGLSSMYLKFEKNSHEEAWGNNKEWGKQKALLKAAAYTVIMGLTMKEAMELAGKTEIAHAAQAKVEGWLGNVLGHHVAPVAPVAKPEASINHATASETFHKLSPTPSEAPLTGNEVKPEIKFPGYDATAEQAKVLDNIAPLPAHEALSGVAHMPQHVPEVAAPPVAAVTQIEMPTVSASSHGYEGMLKEMMKKLPDERPHGLDPKSDLARLFDAKTNPGELHRLALDHKFAVHDGSVRIDSSAKMTIDADGNVHLSDAKHLSGMTDAVKDMKVLHPHVPMETVVQHEAPVAPAAAPEAGTVDVNAHPEAPSSASIVSHAPIIEKSVIVNRIGLDIPVAESHIYAGADAEHLFVYGGSPVERAKAIAGYLTQNPDKIVYGADNSGKYRIPWHLVDGKLEVVGAPIETQGFFNWVSSVFTGNSFMKAPSPDEFEKVIK